ncbi:GNAT family N-acetyltransferase [Pelagerythrobacter sp.]|uniref:GNAT family N-acetyltransferase n=1 Tax=Pelagerythrobacter sp. TaxID=2800702 RepID=UPI0035B38DA9
MASAPLERVAATAANRRAGSCVRSAKLEAVRWHDAEEALTLAEWDDLARSASEPNPFCESWNLLPALAAFARRPVDLLTLRIDGMLCALMPLARSGSYYGYPIRHMANWSHDNLFVGSPLVRHGCEQAFWRALLVWADTHSKGALFLHLDRLAEDGPLFAALSRIAAEETREWAVVQREERALLHSDLAPEAYFECSISSKKRKELRRQHKRLSEEGEVRFERQADADGLDGWIDAFFALEAAGWKGRNGSALANDPHTRDWFGQTLRGAAAQGRLERLTLSLDSAPIAMLANFIAPPGAFSFKTAYDEGYARYSPGVLLQRENLDLLARGDIAWCDSCAAADHPMIERIWREKRAMVRVNVAIGGRLRRALFHHMLRAETARRSRRS